MFVDRNQEKHKTPSGVICIVSEGHGTWYGQFWVWRCHSYRVLLVFAILEAFHA